MFTDLSKKAPYSWELRPTIHLFLECIYSFATFDYSILQLCSIFIIWLILTQVHKEASNDIGIPDQSHCHFSMAFLKCHI